MITVFHVLVAATADVSAYKSVSLKAGAELVLSVPVYGNPKPSVAWKLNDKDLLGNIEEKISSLTLTICKNNLLPNL